VKLVLAGQGPSDSQDYKGISAAVFVLAAYLRAHLPHELKRQMDIETIDFDSFEDPAVMAARIEKHRADMVGFSVYLWNYNAIIECTKLSKKKAPNILIILGGPQVSPIAEEVISTNLHIDMVAFVPSSGETILLAIVKAAMSNQNFNSVNGIIYRDSNGCLVKTSPQVLPVDFETAPSLYDKNVNLFNQDIDYLAVIETSRGCPFSCGFCFWGWHRKKIEYFPLSRALSDIEIVYNNPRVKHVYFADANILSSIDRAKAIIKHIIKQRSQATTDFELDFTCLTEETTNLLASLPNFNFLLAIQTANPNSLKLISKARPSLNAYADKLCLFKKWVPDQNIRIDLMLGLPGDDYNGYLRTLDSVLRLEPYRITINYPIYLLPGTRFFEYKDKWGLTYLPEPPYSIIETPTFPKKDTERGFRLSLWVQTLLSYYPASADLFLKLARQDGLRIERLLRWVSIIEEKINTLDLCGNIVDISVRSVAEWNRRKKYLLETLSSAQSGYAIYSSIYKLEKAGGFGRLLDRIDIGSKVFRYLAREGVDAVEFDSYDLLPQEVIGSEPTGPDQLNDLFSQYKRRP